MEREDYTIEMMAYLDGELDEGRRRRFEEKLASDPALAAELAKYERLSDLTGAMHFDEPSDLEWQDFWNGLYNRLERRTGWILLLVGALFIAVYGIRELIITPEIRPLLKVGILLMLTGFGFLVVSVYRGKQRIKKVDRYHGVHR